MQDPSPWQGSDPWVLVVLADQSCLTLCHPMDCSPLGSYVMEFSRQECWSGLPSVSRGSSWSRDWTQVSHIDLLPSEPPGKCRPCDPWRGGQIRLLIISRTHWTFSSLALCILIFSCGCTPSSPHKAPFFLENPGMVTSLVMPPAVILCIALTTLECCVLFPILDIFVTVCPSYCLLRASHGNVSSTRADSWSFSCSSLSVQSAWFTVGTQDRLTDGMKLLDYVNKGYSHKPGSVLFMFPVVWSLTMQHHSLTHR